MADYPMRDKNYDLISTLYHFSQGAEMSQRYADDAQQSGDSETAEFFQQAQKAYVELGEKGKKLLKDRL